jgi:hypothetical protein
MMANFRRMPKPSTLQQTFRTTPEERALLDHLGETLGLPDGRAGVIREALDFWVSNDPRARQAWAEFRRPQPEG